MEIEYLETYDYRNTKIIAVMNVIILLYKIILFTFQININHYRNT